MAHHKSAKKRIRRNERFNVRNKNYLASVRTAIKSFTKSIEEGVTKEEAGKLFVSAQKLLAKAAAKGMIHSNKASRTVGRLSKRLAGAGEASSAAPVKKAASKKKTTKKAGAKKVVKKKTTKKATTKKKTTKKK